MSTTSASSVLGLPPLGPPIADPFVLTGDTGFGFAVPGGDVGELRAAASRAQVVSLGFSFRADDLQTTIATATARWEGEAQQAFVEYARHLIAIFEANSQTVAEAAGVLGGLADALDSAQRATRAAAGECGRAQQELQAVGAHGHAAHRAKRAQDDFDRAQASGRQASSTYEQAAADAQAKLVALREDLRQASAPHGVPPDLLAVTPADAKRGQALLPAAARIPASEWEKHPGRALRQITGGRGMTPNQVLALVQAAGKEKAKGKGSVIDGIGGLVNSLTIGAVSFGDPLTARYHGGQLAGFIPIDPESIGDDIGRLGEKGVAKTIEHEAADATEHEAPGAIDAARGATEEGPGKWVAANESMSARAAKYQAQITGRSGVVYKVKGVKFDGYADGVLQDAKGPGYAPFVRDGEFVWWFNGSDDFVSQAKRQLIAADGTPIEWSVAEPEVATLIRQLFVENGISGIAVKYVPPKP